MSSISSSDRARMDEKIRQMREEYENREAENAKKKKQELSRVQKRHNEEIESITDNYEGRIDSLKTRNRETLSDRDFANNRKIEEVRQTYRESLRNKMEDAYNTREMQKETYEAQIDKQKQVASAQKENLLGQLNEEISRRDEGYANSIEQNRIKTQKTVHDNARKLNAAHDREKDVLVKSHHETLQEKHRASNQLKSAYQAKLNDSERRREADNARWSQKYQDTVLNSREEYGDNLNMKQMIMNEERESIRGKYENALAKKSNMMDEQNQNFRDTVNERLNSQVRSRDSQIQRLQSKLNNEISKNDRLRGIERRNLTNSYEKRLDIVEAQREDAVDKMKDLNDERISNTLRSNQDLLRRVDRENKSQKTMMTARHREERENLIQTHKDQVQQVSSTADTRVNKIIDLTNKNNEKMGQYYQDSLDTMHGNYVERMDKERERFMADRSESNKAMTERFRSLEKNFGNKLEQTVKRYEDKIAELKDNQAREVKRLENMYSQRTDEREKAVKMEKESLTMKYEAKLAQVNESHEDQLDRMNRRHNEDMQDLAAKISSYNRKA